MKKLWKLGYFWQNSKINYQQGKEEDESGNKVPLRHSPPLFGTTRLVYDDNKYSVIFYADYNGEISYNNLAPSEREKTAIYASDENGNPLGMNTSWETSSSTLSGGSFTVRLQHQPGVKTASSGANDGDSDFDLTFVLNIE